MSLLQARQAIDAIDAQIVALLAQRARIVADVWAHKRAAGQPLIDPGREATMRQQLADLAASQGLDPGAVQSIFDQIVGHDLRAGDRRPHSDR